MSDNERRPLARERATAVCPAINGHGAEDIRAAVIGAALGLLAGIVIELQGSPPIRGSKHEAIKG